MAVHAPEVHIRPEGGGVVGTIDESFRALVGGQRPDDLAAEAGPRMAAAATTAAIYRVNRLDCRPCTIEYPRLI